jgi:hypothetical protein
MRQKTKLATHYLIGNQRTATVVSVGNREGTLNAPLPQASDRTRFRRSAARIALASVGTLCLVFMMLATPATSSAAISFGISVTIAPPAMPVYAQPICPGPGYLWTPGYWAYDPVNGYYWVPGTWITPPAVGLLWTPGYWGWGGGAFLWHAGYWGPTVGFYGGINYGFGYTGVGFFGGYWNHGAFFYNRSVTNVNVTNITNVYNKTVVNNITVNHVSYNGGAGGITAQPTDAQLAAARASHYQATAAQAQQEQLAHSNRAQWASVNHGAPTVAATARPGAFTGGGVVRASQAGGPYRPAPAAAAANRSVGRTANPAGGGTRPLITAHPSTPAGTFRAQPHVQQPATAARAARPQVQRPAARPAQQTPQHPASYRPASRSTPHAAPQRPAARPAAHPAAQPAPQHAAQPQRHPEPQR